VSQSSDLAGQDRYFLMCIQNQMK